jgi:hypothetical protein
MVQRNSGEQRNSRDGRKEVDPEPVKLIVDETESIAGWFSAANAAYRFLRFAKDADQQCQ